MLAMVGRLGVIIDVTFAISPNFLVKRTVSHETAADFAAQMRELQEKYVACVAESCSASGIPDALQDAYESRQYFWHVAANDFMQMDFEPLEDDTNMTAIANGTFDYQVQPSVVTRNSGGRCRSLSAGQKIKPKPQGGPHRHPQKHSSPRSSRHHSPPASSRDGSHGSLDAIVCSNSDVSEIIDITFEDGFLVTTGAPNISEMYSTLNRMLFRPGTFPARDSYPSQNLLNYAVNKHLNVYDQFELAIPFSKAGDCFTHLVAVIYPGPEAPEEDQLALGIPIPALIRFIKAEDIFLSPCYGEPCVYLNIEDYFSHSSAGENTGTPNTWIHRVLAAMRGPRCRGRMHWGKAGWNEHAQRFNGSEEYPQSWCDFGCFVKEMDPNGKFQVPGLAPPLASVTAVAPRALARCTPHPPRARHHPV
ncbi:hypothetical protein CYMTET_47158 [Cymbomonas tetramitiformis]|uniref:D-arabinono-1,4-lactone oxidase C-terminal domain-containing protein n=1 Tax=Cymbomonas tetramitiformis TaxID=36881 RepID=A0AAE0EWX6_9CHLO|nr:hypothetical protein CYMTET_47158 [Cymbomonas tetramitiformis]